MTSGDTWLRDLDSLDWADPTDVEAVTSRALDTILSTDGLLSSLVRGVGKDEHLLGLSQRYIGVTKLVLHDGDVYRLRMHLFHAGHVDPPHSHRFPMSVRILTGKYLHQIFGREDELLDGSKRPLRARVVRRETAGDGYVLDDESVHSISVPAPAVSLMIRGPIVKERAVGLDDGGEVVFKFGAAKEDPMDLERARITSERLESAVASLRTLAVMQ